MGTVFVTEVFLGRLQKQANYESIEQRAYIGRLQSKQTRKLCEDGRKNGYNIAERHVIQLK